MAALRSLKSERLVSLIMPQRGLQVVPQREVCAYDAICYLINDASHQEWTVCWMQIWYRKEVVPLSHGITSNLKEQHFILFIYLFFKNSILNIANNWEED